VWKRSKATRQEASVFYICVCGGRLGRHVLVSEGKSEWGCGESRFFVEDYERDNVGLVFARFDNGAVKEGGEVSTGLTARWKRKERW
jgi:hypothetical protein